jgi:hypothetical protein
MKLRANITKKDIHSFCRGQFYADNHGTPWEPFENHPKEQLKEFVEDMEFSLMEFLKAS